MSNFKVIKSFILAFLLILSSALFWKGLADIYLGGNMSAGSFIWLGISLLFFVILFLFFSLLVDYKLIFLTIYSLSLFTFFIFFPFKILLLIGLIVMFGVMIVSRILMQKERKERLNISVRGVFKNGLPWLMTFLALFISFVGYFHSLAPTSKDEINIPSSILNLFVKPLAGTLSKTLPMLDENTTIDEALSMSVATQNIDLISLSPQLLVQLKGKNFKDLNINELLKDPEIAKILQKEAVKQAKNISPQILAEQRNDLAKNLGISLTGDETISDVINKLINTKVKDMFGPTIGFLPIISVILTFIVLRIIFIPFGWLVIIFSLLIFQLLVIFRFVYQEKVMKEGKDVRI